MPTKTLQSQQINSKMLAFAAIQNVAMPPSGWIYAIRFALGISAQQLANKLSVTRQAIKQFENNEKNGTITVKSLREAARAMDMQFVYALIPIDGSLEQLIDRKAKELATQIVLRTSNTMKLEDQENTKERIEKAIEERTIAIKNEMPKALWD